jgi:cytochrome d ubiquinol oxidase subunit I
MVQTQPMKMAAAEALWNTEDPASFSLITIGNLQGNRQVWAIRVPDLLSILAFNSPNGKVEGINQLQAQYVKAYGPGNYIPPIFMIYWSFRLMVGAGIVMLLLALFGLYLTMRRRLEQTRWYLFVMILAMALPYLANTTGWLMTELGRQPWIVFGLLRTQDGVSPTTTTTDVLISLIAFAVIYGALMIADVYLIARFARQGVGLARAQVAPGLDHAGRATTTAQLTSADETPEAEVAKADAQGDQSAQEDIELEELTEMY